MSKDTMYKGESCRISIQNENESSTVNSLMVQSLRTGTKIFARDYMLRYQLKIKLVEMVHLP